MKIWLDDIRTPPSSDWHWCKTAWEVIALIVTKPNEIEHIAFDHDLGHGAGSGHQVVQCLEFYFHNGWVTKLPEWSCQSDNGPGRNNIIQTMKSLERYAKEK